MVVLHPGSLHAADSPSKMRTTTEDSATLVALDHRRSWSGAIR
jgi:hypothetical protein